MSEETKENNSAQPSSASPAGQAAPPPVTKAAPEPPPPPPPGEFGQRLEQAGVAVSHLGPDATGMEMIAVERDVLLRASQFLRDECAFDLMLSCSAVDWKERRESVYHLFSTTSYRSLALKVTADENEHSPSLVAIWPAAECHEREAYDLMGIHYDGHPNLTRILMPLDWVGHPLRKDYKNDDPRLVWNQR